jgi:hypothetical protein
MQEEKNHLEPFLNRSSGNYQATFVAGHYIRVERRAEIFAQ